MPPVFVAFANPIVQHISQSAIYPTETTMWCNMSRDRRNCSKPTFASAVQSADFSASLPIASLQCPAPLDRPLVPSLPAHMAHGRPWKGGVLRLTYIASVLYHDPSSTYRYCLLFPNPLACSLDIASTSEYRCQPSDQQLTRYQLQLGNYGEAYRSTDIRQRQSST